MARSRKSGRFAKTTRRRRSKPKTNLTNLAVSALVANSITKGAFNTNLVEFVTGNTEDARLGNGNKFGSDGSYVMSLPELMGIGSSRVGGNYGAGVGGFQGALMRNLKANWLEIAMGVVLIPVVAKTATKLIRKPVILPANRMLKSVGLDVKV